MVADIRSPLRLFRGEAAPSTQSTISELRDLYAYYGMTMVKSIQQERLKSPGYNVSEGKALKFGAMTDANMAWDSNEQSRALKPIAYAKGHLMNLGGNGAFRIFSWDETHHVTKTREKHQFFPHAANRIHVDFWFWRRLLDPTGSFGPGRSELLVKNAAEMPTLFDVPSLCGPPYGYVKAPSAAGIAA